MTGDQENSRNDVLGIRAYGEAVRDLSRAAIDGASAFLRTICQPAAEEFGLLFRDQISYWRFCNTVRIAQKAEQKLKQAGGIRERSAHPRMVVAALEKGSWNDVDEVQEMWAGLLASSCSEDGRDESNLIFINLLGQLTTGQARILNYVCQEAEKVRTQTGLIDAMGVYRTVSQLMNVSGINDMQRLDRELDHLRALQLIGGGIHTEPVGNRPEVTAYLQPTGLALHMYVRSQGFAESPLEFFGLETAE